MLEGENLPPVAQRALRQQPDLRQAVDHDALGLQPFDGLEYPLDGFAELEIRRIEQALMLIRIKHAFRRHQLHDLDLVANRPAVRSRAFAQFALSLGQADVDANLVHCRRPPSEIAARSWFCRSRGYPRAGAAGCAPTRFQALGRDRRYRSWPAAKAPSSYPSGSSRTLSSQLESPGAGWSRMPQRDAVPHNARSAVKFPKDQNILLNTTI